MMRPAFVYFLRCADGSIYTGWAFDVARRLLVHQQGRGARYTRTRRPVKLLYSEQLPSRREAMLREIALKRWTRTRKLALAKDAKKKKSASGRVGATLAVARERTRKSTKVRVGANHAVARERTRKGAKISA